MSVDPQTDESLIMSVEPQTEEKKKLFTNYIFLIPDLCFQMNFENKSLVV